MKDQIAAKAASSPSTTSEPIAQISQPKPTTSNETEDLPKVTIVKRAVKWTSIERMKMNLKKGKHMWTQKDKQAAKEAFNTLMSQIRNKTGYGCQKQASIAPLSIGLGIAGGLAATNMATSLATGDAPLSWLGDITSSILGFSSSAATQRTLIKMDKIAEQFETVQVNVREISQTIADVKQKMETLEKHLDGIHIATEAIAREQDLKAHASHVQTVQIFTLNK